jgi:hypothetical protein
MDTSWILHTSAVLKAHFTFLGDLTKTKEFLALFLFYCGFPKKFRQEQDSQIGNPIPRDKVTCYFVLCSFLLNIPNNNAPIKAK